MAVESAAATQTARTLHRALKVRHLATLSIGGMLGSGLFLGVGGALSSGGLGIVFVYLLGGLVIIGVMAGFAELFVQGQTAGGFATYAQERLSPWAGSNAGWNYLLAWAAGMGVIGIAGGTYVHSLSAVHDISRACKSPVPGGDARNDMNSGMGA